ncbi:MAG TPA: hypothetical protein VNO30_25540 [Kofleriaceae bacterium]|nr:hypothetical protein [Kofleriaceae bacterium]
MKRGIVVALLAAGCWKSSPPPATVTDAERPLAQEPAPSPSPGKHHAARPAPQRPRGSSADALAKLDEFADDMCACADRTCVDAVTQEMTRWSQEMRDEFKDLKPTDEETAQATRSMERLSKCMTAAMSAGSAGPSLAPGPP